MSRIQNAKIQRVTDATLVIGVDIAKKTHVARAIDWRGIELGKHLSFENSRNGFERLYRWLEAVCSDHDKSDIIVGMEPTGHYGMNLQQFLRQRGTQVVLVNPAHVKKSKELDDNSPTKNDVKDAYVIARMVIEGRYSAPVIPQDVYAELRTGMNERDRLSSDLQRVKGRVHNWLDRFFPDFFEVFKDWEGKAAVATLRMCPMPQELAAKTADEVVHMWKEHGVRRGVGIKRARLLVDIAKTSIGLSTGPQMARQEIQFLLSQYDLIESQLDELMGQIEKLMCDVPGTQQMLSIPNIGLITVAGFIAEIGDLSQYTSWQQLRKLAGLNLKENSSGKHKGQTKISKRGRSRLRALLYNCVFFLVANNPQFRALHQYFKTRVDNPLKPKQSLVALTGKLIRILFTLGTRKVDYDATRALGPVHQDLLNVA